METKKKGKNLTILLICLSILVLIGLNIYQHQHIERFSQGANQKTSQETSVDVESNNSVISESDKGIQKSHAQKTALAGVEKEAYIDEVDELEYQLDAAEEELDMIHEQIADEAARKAELKKMESELQKKYREDPSYRKMMRNSLERQYGDLFDELNLSSERLEEFKDILLDNQMAYFDFYTEIQGVTPSEEKRAEFDQRQKALREDQQAKIKEFLGNEDYVKYQEDRMTWGLKYNVTNFMANLRSEEGLTETQQQDLVEAMKEELENFGSEIADEDDKFLFPSERYDEEYIERMLEYQDLMNEAYLNAAENILSSSQVEKYKEYLKQQRDKIESSMKLQALKYDK